MQHLDEGTIHAWLDGALSSEEAARAEAHVASCPACADAVAEARGLVAASSRILLALDNVPSVRGAKGARGAMGARWGRPFLATWLVRERIAAVVALVVAGGALAVVLSRGGPQDAMVQVASEPVHTVDLTAAESPAPPPSAASDARKAEAQPRSSASGRGADALELRARDLGATRRADSAPTLLAPANVAPTVTAEVAAAVAAAAPARTDDTLRQVAVAQAYRAEAQDRSAAPQASVSEKLADALPRRRAAADASARFAEPGAAEGAMRGLAGAATRAEDARLVQDERMTEGGREVRRRIYRVDDILVTLDERLSPLELEERRPALPTNVVGAAPPADSVARATNTIRWTDARGAELTLTGAASKEKLEQIRKVLGL